MRRQLPIAVAIILSLVFQTKAFADGTVELSLRVGFEPAKVLGLIISSRPPLEKSGVKLSKAQSGEYIVSFGYSDDEAGDDGVATALAVSTEGEIAFADVRSISQPDLDKLYLSIPNCAEEPLPEPDPDVYQNVALLELLFETRSSRREVHRVQVEQLLSGKVLERLQNIEMKLGFSYEVPLSATLPPQTLLDRVQRIRHALSALKG